MALNCKETIFPVMVAWPVSDLRRTCTTQFLCLYLIHRDIFYSSKLAGTQVQSGDGSAMMMVPGIPLRKVFVLVWKIANNSRINNWK